jgi:hypothetical protein
VRADSDTSLGLHAREVIPAAVPKDGSVRSRVMLAWSSQGGLPGRVDHGQYSGFG